jgi:hypothetical protein
MRFRIRMPSSRDHSQARASRLQWDVPVWYPESDSPAELVPQTALRWRRLGGYRREDVELLLMECRLMLREADHRIDSLRDRERKLEEEVSALRGELAGAQAKAEASQQLLGKADRLLWDVHELIAEARASTGEVAGEASAEEQPAAVEMSEGVRTYVEPEPTWEAELAG